MDAKDHKLINRFLLPAFMLSIMATSIRMSEMDFGISENDG